MTVLVTEVKQQYLQSIRHFFPDHKLSTQAIVSRTGRLHVHFLMFAHVLQYNAITSQQYIPFCFNQAERAPTPQQLSTPEYINEYRYVHK